MGLTARGERTPLALGYSTKLSRVVLNVPNLTLATLWTASTIGLMSTSCTETYMRAK